jgi:CubicO group peptidase (beta-lactamase class C family)
MSHRPVTADCLATLTSSFEEQDWAAPSVTFALFDRDGVVEQRTVHRAGAPGPDADDSTPYRICSMSKSFTAALVLVLRDAGRLRLSDPVRQYVPELPVHTDAGGTVRDVTVEMLLSNSSGLPEDNPWADHHLDMTRDDLLSVLEHLRFVAVPGEEYHYSNTGWATLGLVVERITGEPYLDVLERTVLRPLGLTSTSADPAGVAPGRETYDAGATWHDRPFVGTGAYAPAGALCSTAADVARWAGWLSSAFVQTGPDDVLAAASRREMQRLRTSSQVADRRGRPELRNVGYGFGVNVEQDERFGVVVQHSGGLPGASSHMRWHAASGLGVVVLANATDVPVAAWSAAALRGVLLDVEAPARELSLWPETWTAAQVVDDAIRRGAGVRELEPWFSANVLSDVPAEVRDAQVRELVAGVGGLVAPGGTDDMPQRVVRSRSASQLTWSVPGVSGALRCRIELTATVPARVQRLDVLPDSVDDGDAHTVVSHYRVRPPR